MCSRGHADSGVERWDPIVLNMWRQGTEVGTIVSTSRHCVSLLLFSLSRGQGVLPVTLLMIKRAIVTYKVEHFSETGVRASRVKANSHAVHSEPPTGHQRQRQKLFSTTDGSRITY